MAFESLKLNLTAFFSSRLFGSYYSVLASNLYLLSYIVSEIWLHLWYTIFAVDTRSFGVWPQETSKVYFGFRYLEPRKRNSRAAIVRLTDRHCDNEARFTTLLG